MDFREPPAIWLCAVRSDYSNLTPPIEKSSTKEIRLVKKYKLDKLYRAKTTRPTLER